MLRSFAVSARVGLLRDVSARLVGVLAPGSQERVEDPRVVAALEAAIAGGGGGDVGRAVVVDRVAYTWFNRIVALRFMDANGFTGVGVVSPDAGHQIGQPEVLADAKAGQLDLEVVSAKGCELITALLNGSRRSSDAQGEAYGVLLAEYCRHWNRVMPFMFERAGDFTELLIPANLLAPDSLLVKANEVMTAEVCADVEVIGWLYQFYISERKDEVFAGFKKGKKAGAKEIPAATQLFTPDWIVRYLVENSLGRLWLLNNPQSKLADQMDYYIAPVDEETDFLKITSPEELKIMDPACGSGHMLTYAFDLLCAIYEEAGYAPNDIPGLILSKNLFGVEIDQRAGSLAAFALAMKARARQRTFFNKDIQPNIFVLQNVHFTPDELDDLVTSGGDRFAEEDFWQAFEYADTFGSLIQPDETLLPSLRMHVDQVTRTDQLFTQDLYNRADTILTQAEYLSKRYHVVVANPPYMGRGNMGSELSDFLETHFPSASTGLDSSFIARSGPLVLDGGFSAFVTMQSWMFLSSYEQFRRELLTSRGISTLAHLGSGVFDSFGGEVVAVVATVFRHSVTSALGSYLRLNGDGDRVVELMAAAEDPSHRQRFDRDSLGFLRLRGALIAYFANDAISDFLSRPPLRLYLEAGVGSQTGANERYVRYWFEVSSEKLNLLGREGVDGRKWTPATKGGEFRRWYNPTIHVMDWRREGGLMKEQTPGAVIRNASLYFRENISWTKVGTRIPSFRYSDDRVVHNDASCFLVSDTTSLDSVSAYLNSRTVTLLVKELNPTLNLLPSSLLDFPFIELNADMGRRCRELSALDWNSQELSLEFSGPSLLRGALQRNLSTAAVGAIAQGETLTIELAGLENAIEQEVAASAGLGLLEAIPWHEHSLLMNPEFRYGPGKTAHEYELLVLGDLARDLVSFAIGCIFGRYSPDAPGLVLADQGATLQDFLSRVPEPGFMPDADNVIPIVDGDWFEDDIVARFREFLRVAFGEEHFEENLRFVTETLGVKELRDYFVKSFYKDHVQRYKKRPIYWLFSSPKGSFNALIYMHRYNPSTVSTVLNEYLREYKAKLSASLQHHERLAVGAGSAKEQAVATKEADRLRKVILELDEYEHDVLYPLASQQIAIDLDDGVKANYPKFGAALKKIPGLEASDE